VRKEDEQRSKRGRVILVVSVRGFGIMDTCSMNHETNLCAVITNESKTGAAFVNQEVNQEWMSSRD